LKENDTKSDGKIMAVQREIDYNISFDNPDIVNGLSVHLKEFDEHIFIVQ
jgi:hypothetical protein